MRKATAKTLKMTHFTLDVFQAIANATDAKTCARLLCVNACSFSLTPSFPKLHITRTSQTFQKLFEIMQTDYKRLCNKTDQYPYTVKTLQNMFSCTYSPELQYILHKQIQEVMQNDYSFSDVQTSLENIISSTGKNNEQDNNIFDIVSSCIHGNNFVYVLNIITYDEKHEIILTYDNKHSKIELFISGLDDSTGVLCEREFAICDVESIVKNIIETCGEYAIAKQPNNIDISISCNDSISLFCPYLYNICISGYDKNIIERIAEVYTPSFTFKNKSTETMMALFSS